jgi:negative regulator of sigma-B (phosphoserine phosphatase)
MDLNMNGDLKHASLIRSCIGESVSGDAVVIHPLEHGLFVAIVDVLGHGPEAHELTHVIDAFLERQAPSKVSDLMTGLHRHLKGTRGAAVGLCAIDSEAGR